ncbi:MAG: peptidoglycan-binding domain-containing protein [Scytonema sp. PMC 1069.18]|nr:peptidoglycan-binding domain-containing protein [Scytonema sp. PMC 1069.18]MEC4885985.1 peptidoglycan-binding domain-containing protein [Scytonema sp. PMC 1070.18]
MDGVFGERTDSVVRQFQQSSNLKVDGIVGSKTWAAFVS